MYALEFDASMKLKENPTTTCPTRADEEPAVSIDGRDWEFVMVVEFVKLKAV